MIKKWRKNNVNNEKYNLLYVTLDAADTENATNEIKACLKIVEDNIEDRISGKKSGKFYLLANTSKLGRPALVETTASFTSFMKRIRPFVKDHLLGSVLVIPNSFIRGILNAVFKIHPPTTSVQLVSTEEEALKIFNVTKD